MAEKYPADSSQNDEGNEVTDSPVDLDSANQAVLAYATPADPKQERRTAGGSPSKMVTGHSAALTGQKDEKLVCILETPIGEAPHAANLKTKLKILLDPPRPLGGDIKSLASAFGYTSNEINFLTTKQYGSATEELMNAEGGVSIEFLLGKLVFIKREDAAGKLREYIRSQNCKCGGCEKTLI